MEKIDIDKKRVLFTDLDGTIIDTVSGKTFPEGLWDMKFKFDVLDTIKKCSFKCLIIVSNQGGIARGFINEKRFCKGKMNYVQYCLEDYLGIPVEYSYCASDDKDCEYRKPNIGMLVSSAYKFLPRWNIVASKDEMLMIGDASGKEGQFSDSDKKTAENYGIDYLDVADFISLKSK